MLRKLFYLTLITLVFCCKSDDNIPDCSLVLCAAPHVLVNLTDNETDQNYLTKNNISEESIEVRDESNNIKTFSFNDSNGLLFIEKNEDKKGAFKILIDAVLITTFNYDTAKPKTNQCCDFGILKDVLLSDNKTYEVEGNTLTIYL